jgi:succinate-semialdehyde dehydrogenase/glutarate-semialdehyde dehydrogenase
MYATINPATGETLKHFPFHPFPDINLSVEAYNKWKKLSIAERGTQLKKVADLLEKRKEQYALLITTEMGKPLREAEYEITKTLTAFNYYIDNAEGFLASEGVSTQASKSYIRFDPLGIIMAIMPWNFPFWQVFRCAVPTLMAGNVSILKHAPNVPGCAAAIEQLFHDAGITDGVYKNYYLTNEDAAKLISLPEIAGLSFTGSDTTGAYLAGLAGSNLKKAVMELGGNDAFIVLEDASMEMAVAGAIKSRAINSGQSCNGAKRFIIVGEARKNEFTARLNEAVSKLNVGDPLNPETHIGPLARPDLADKVRGQVQRSITDGAVAHFHPFKAKEHGNFVAPVVLENVTPDVTSFKEECFGPVFSVIHAKSEAHAIELANKSQFGLGASVWTNDNDKAAVFIEELNAGNVYVNDIVKSDPRLPFGGVKRSGFGRELSEHGLKEFVNIKTVYIH